ncbi:MAG: hypothetical protein H7123_07340 [Thermoleophilia bacterium]|nr:hypothetical protein [Thermoleophilia bacterium]
MKSEIQLAQELQEASKPTELPPTPSFEPWLIRVRTVRAGITSAAMLFTTLGAAWTGTNWVDAVLQGMVASIVTFFVAWACALWICSEMYASEVRAARLAWADRERIRQQAIRDLYRQRMDLLHGTGTFDDDALDNLMEFAPPPPGMVEQAHANLAPDTWQQQAA